MVALPCSTYLTEAAYFTNLFWLLLLSKNKTPDLGSAVPVLVGKPSGGSTCFGNFLR